MPTIDNWRALRDALEAGPTDGPFYADGARADLHAVRVKHPTMVGAVFADVGYSGSTKQDTINAEYIAAAHPAAIRSLLAERDRLAAEVEALRAEVNRAVRGSILVSDCLHHQILAMRAAAVAGELESPERGMQWIVNTLAGPGNLPDLDEARAIGGAQAMFDKEMAEHEAFREAHPAPTIDAAMKGKP